MPTEHSKNWHNKPPQYNIGDILEPRTEMPDSEDEETWLVLDIDRPKDVYRYVLLELYSNQTVYWSCKFVEAYTTKVA